LIMGNPGRRPITNFDPAMSGEPHDNGLEPPVKLAKRQKQLWQTYIRPASWLTQFDVPRAFMWVELHSEFEKAPSQMIASRIAQLRALGSELGLDPSSRSRLGGVSDEPEDPGEQYLNNA